MLLFSFNIFGFNFLRFRIRYDYRFSYFYHFDFYVEKIFIDFNQYSKLVLSPEIIFYLKLKTTESFINEVYETRIQRLQLR